MWIIIDSRTGLQVGKQYDSSRKAHAKADRLDSVYGAVRYIVKPV